MRINIPAMQISIIITRGSKFLIWLKGKYGFMIGCNFIPCHFGLCFSFTKGGTIGV